MNQGPDYLWLLFVGGWGWERELSNNRDSIRLFGFCSDAFEGYWCFSIGRVCLDRHRNGPVWDSSLCIMWTIWRERNNRTLIVLSHTSVLIFFLRSLYEWCLLWFASSFIFSFLKEKKKYIYIYIQILYPRLILNVSFWWTFYIHSMYLRHLLFYKHFFFFNLLVKRGEWIRFFSLSRQSI